MIGSPLSSGRIGSEQHEVPVRDATPEGHKKDANRARE